MSSVAEEGPGRTPRWAVVVPVKTLSRAKTRLHGHPRPALMRAFALDTVTAALGTPAVGSVHVVTAETGLAAEVAALGCDVLADEGDGDLNRALGAAVRHLPPGPVASLLGDLPALDPQDLQTALTWATVERVPCFVADADGTGTTLLAAPSTAAFAPRYGPGSAAAHAGAGNLAVPLPVPTLRRDVDTAEDLAAAVDLGVGPQTRVLLAGG